MGRVLTAFLCVALLAVSFPSIALAEPDSNNPAGVTDPGLLALITDDDLFATMDLSVVLDAPLVTDPSDKPTKKFGPYESMSPDSGTCGNNWADDTFDRHFNVKNRHGSITVIEQFKDGSFVTPSTEPPNTNESPGACQDSPLPAGSVNPGVTGKMHGYFIISIPTGTTQTSDDPHCNADTQSDANCDTATFINTHFDTCNYPFTCSVTTYFFHYSAGDQGLIQHEWKNASDDRGGNHGDIRSTDL